MGHYDEQREAFYREVALNRQRAFCKYVLEGRLEKYFEVAEECGMDYVPIPRSDAKTMYEIVREHAAMLALKKTS